MMVIIVANRLYRGVAGARLGKRVRGYTYEVMFSAIFGMKRSQNHIEAMLFRCQELHFESYQILAHGEAAQSIRRKVTVTATSPTSLPKIIMTSDPLSQAEFHEGR
jgi:hypothetical protein